MSNIESALKEKLLTFPKENVEPYLSELKKIDAGRSDAILAYGSCLSPITKSKTSTPDFFLVVERYRTFHSSSFHALLNWIMPPSIYHFAVDGQIAKYNVIRWRDLERETSMNAKDVYIVGRFSKRMAIASAKTPTEEDRLARIQAEGMRSVARRVLHLVPETFTTEAFAKEALRLSYYGDVRVEAADKADKIFEAERNYYVQIYGEILKEFENDSAVSWNPSVNAFEKPVSSKSEKRQVQKFIKRSQRRAQLRWPKFMFTISNWVDYMLAKVERTQGIKLELTEKEKKFWYIYGWKYFFQLRRKNLIK